MTQPSIPFVGREEELGRVSALVARARAGNGGIALVEGAAGAGKSLFLAEVVRRSASGEPGDVLVAVGQCYEETGQSNAFQPFTEIMDVLAAASSRRQGLLSMAGSVVRRTAPDWLQAVPVVGPLLSAGAKTITAGAEVMSESRSVGRKFESLSREYARTILAAAASRSLLVLVVEDAHWMDPASCELLLRLAAELPGKRVVVVLTCRPGDMAANDALVRARAILATRRDVETVRLGGLGEREIAAYLEHRFGTTFFPAMPAWLLHLCQGHPMFVAQYLNLLEEEGIVARDGDGYAMDGRAERSGGEWELSGRLATMPISRDVESLLDQRILRLQDEEREMLQLAAVQGQRFGSLVLARVVDQKELAVLARLRRVSERHRIIGLHTGSDWMRDRSEVYAFEHFLMQQAFYRKLTPRERTLYHREIADVLEPLIAEYDDAPRLLLLDVARHRRASGQPLEAARHYHLAAESSYRDGVTVETMQLCEEVAGLLRTLPPDGAERDRLFAESVLLHLMCTMYGPVDAGANRQLIALAAEGEAAAARAGRTMTRVEIQAATGQLHIRAGDVPAALGVMRGAVDLARETGDAPTTFFALAQLGRQLGKEDLAESIRVRAEALAMFDDAMADPSLTAETRAMLARQGANLRVYVGVGQLDSGEFEPAIRSLEAGMRELEALRMFDDLTAVHNYLAQAFAAIGRLDDAEETLRRSFERLPAEEDGLPNPWVGYNHGLLAWVLMEGGRLDEAEREMQEAVRISEATRQADLVTLVQNYRAELLMQRDHRGRDLAEARQVLDSNLRASLDGGFLRSAALSHSLLALLDCEEGRPGEALEHSGRAEALVREHGDMPALRTEEIHYNHHRVLLAVGGREAEAAEALARAREVLERKAARLVEPRNREGFMRVPLSRAIVDASGAAAAGEVEGATG